MALHGVLEIPIDDAAFNRFKAKFDEYAEALKAAPGAWAESSTAIAASAALVGSLTDTMTELLGAQNKYRDAVEKTGSAWSGVEKTARSFVDHVINATSTLLRWSGISGALSLAGLDLLAGGVSRTRNQALGYGATFGEQSALGLTWGRYFDTGGTEQDVSGALSNIGDIGAQLGLRRLGVSQSTINTGDAAKITAAAIPLLADQADKLAAQAQARGQNPQQMYGLFLQAMQLQGVFSPQQMTALHNLSPQERTERQKQQEDYTTLLGLSPEDTKAIQDFYFNLQLITKELEVNIGRVLAQFAPQINKGITDLAHYIGSPDFQTDIKNFTADLHDLGSALHVTAQSAAVVGSDAIPVVSGAVLGFLLGGPAGAAAGAAAGLAFGEITKAIQGAKVPNLSADDARKILRGEWTPDMGLPPPGDWPAMPSTKSLVPPSGSLGDVGFNIGNIKDPKTGAFLKYPSLEAGIIGDYNQLMEDITVHHQNTLRQIVEGNKEHGGWTATQRPAYLGALVSRLGLGADQPIDPTDRALMSRLIAAQSTQEGRRPVTPSVVITVLNQTGGNPVQVISQLPQ